MMKKLITLMVMLTLCGALTSCIGGEGDPATQKNQSKIFKVHDYEFWLTTPKGWEEEKSTNFNLQCQSPQSDMYLSVFGYLKMDLPEDQSVQNLFELQNDSLISLRSNVSEIEPVSSTEDDQKIIYSALYSGEFGGAKNYYLFSLVEFKDTGDMVWILFTGMPSVIEENRDNIDGIISSVVNRDPRL